MRRTWITAVGVLAAMGIAPLARAADHADGPQASADPTADITDVFAWMSGDGAKVYLAMDVAPNATNMTKFSNTVKYAFHTKSDSSLGKVLLMGEMPTDVNTVICTFDVMQKISCWVVDKTGKTLDYVNGDASAPAGVVSADMKVKVFAGPRSDPFFFNVDGFKDVVDLVKAGGMALMKDGAGCPKLDMATSAIAVKDLSHSVKGTMPPVNHFGPKTEGLTGNVLSIVVAIDKTLLTSDPVKLPTLGVWASTNK